MSLAGFEGSVELRFTSDKSRGNAKIHDAIHSLAKIQGTDADRRNCGHPRTDRGRIIENYRNLPPAEKFLNPDGPFPPKPWALHPMDYTGNPDKDYLITSGPNAKAYQQNYVRYVGGATWHWAGTLWRLTPEDMMLNSKFGVGRDWPFDYSVLEPYYVRAEYAIGAAGPSDPALQWPPIRSKPYMMEAFPFGSGQRRCVMAAESIGLRYIPCAQARNNNLAYQGRPPCSGNNNCMPACPIAAKYDAYSALLRIEAKGGVVVPNAVVYRVETDDKNNVQALHYYDPNKISTRTTGKTFVLACNGIETPKILLLSKNDRNPNGVANSSDQVGRNMMDTPKVEILVKFKEPVWSGLGPVQTGAIMSTSQGDFRSQYAGGQISLVNFSPAGLAGLSVLKQKLVGKALDEAIRRETACNGVIAVEHEVLPYAENRLTLSDKKDVLGLNKQPSTMTSAITRAKVPTSTPFRSPRSSRMRSAQRRSPACPASCRASTSWAARSWARMRNRPS